MIAMIMFGLLSFMLGAFSGVIYSDIQYEKKRLKQAQDYWDAADPQRLWRDRHVQEPEKNS